MSRPIAIRYTYLMDPEFSETSHTVRAADDGPAGLSTWSQYVPRRRIRPIVRRGREGATLFAFSLTPVPWVSTLSEERVRRLRREDYWDTK